LFDFSEAGLIFPTAAAQPQMKSLISRSVSINKYVHNAAAAAFLTPILLLILCLIAGAPTGLCYVARGRGASGR
jgi:hypothetical protein